MSRLRSGRRASRIAASAAVFAVGALGAFGAIGCGGGGPMPATPTADAGPDRVARVGDVVVLDGTASRASGEGTPRFAWTQASGPTAPASDPRAPILSFVPPAAGTYAFDLRVASGSPPGDGDPADRATVVVVDDLSSFVLRHPAAEPALRGVAWAAFLPAAPSGDLRASPPRNVRVDATEVPASVVDLSADAADDPDPASVADLRRIDLVVEGAVFARLYYPLAPGDEDPASLAFDDGSGAPVRSQGVVGAAFVLDGTRSHDDGVVRSFVWKQLAAPFELEVDGPALTVVPLVPGTYEFELVVTDDSGLASFPRRVRVPVVPVGQPIAGPPAARATAAFGATEAPIGGREAFVSVVGSTLGLDATASLSFAGGAPGAPGAGLLFEWGQTQGPRASGSGTDTPTPSFRLVAAGAHEFEVRVTDANGVSDTASVAVSVAPAGAVASLATIAPVIDGVLPGPGLPPLVVALDGRASRAPPGATFHWTQTAGPPFVVEGGASGLGLVTIDQPGSYEFELRIFEGLSFSPPATVTFTVR